MPRGAKRASKIVLVVEDEPLVRLVAVEGLEDAGFEVVEAESADEAIAILEARTDIRIVFTDIMTPGSMDGMKLAAAIRGRWPPIELVVTSAFPGPARSQMPTRGIFLPKPYELPALVKAVQSFG